MTRTLTIQIHDIATDGLPDMANLTGRVAFLWNGAIASGWPLDNVGRPGQWETCEDALGMRPFVGVTHWVEFPVPLWELAPRATAGATDDPQ
jgi:hypothetical protein